MVDRREFLKLAAATGTIAGYPREAVASGGFDEELYARAICAAGAGGAKQSDETASAAAAKS